MRLTMGCDSNFVTLENARLVNRIALVGPGKTLYLVASEHMQPLASSVEFPILQQQ